MEKTITLNMLFSRLHQLHPELPLPECKTNPAAPVSGIRLLPHGAKTYAADCLYVCSSDHPFLCDIDTKDFYILCVGQDPAENDSRNFIHFCTKWDVADVFNVILGIYTYFTEWQKDLDYALFRGASLQEIVDLGEPVLDDPMVILDPSLKVLAYTKDHSADEDQAFSFATREGYMSPESVRLFEKDRTFERIHRDSFVSSEPNEARTYPDMIRGIKLNDGSTIYIVLLLTGSADREYVTELFKIFSDTLETAFHDRKIDFHRERNMEDYFLIELLEKKDISPEAIEERLGYIKLPMEGRFLLCTIYSDLRQTSSEPYFINALRNTLVGCHIVTYDNSIIVLFILDKNTGFHPADYVCRRFGPLESMLREHNAMICVSRPFSTLAQFSAARRQTENVRFLSQKKGSDSLYEFYENYSTPCLFLVNSSFDLLYDFCDPALLKMYQSDDPKAKYQIRILAAYLEYGMRSSDAARALNMHRNNVIYHINRMCEACSWDLGDPSTVMNLSVSLSALYYVSTFGKPEEK